MLKVWALLLAAAGCSAAQPLTARNLEAPFCYLPGGVRSWPVLAAPLPAGTHLRVSPAVATNLRFAITPQHKLEITATPGALRPSAELRLEAVENGRVVQSQTLHVRAAPPTRPVTYYADFGDDLINIFGIGVGAPPSQLHHQLREGGPPIGHTISRDAAGLPIYDPPGFDQYFRRLQCQGVAKEILWLMPFPLITSPDAYDPQDWREFVAQGKALLDSPDLQSIVLKAEQHSSWGWVRDLIAFRLDPQLHQALSDSALAHGIALALSFRPLEPAVSKYYEITAFDAAAHFLWDYRPLASPAVNAHPDQVGFAHYRELLRRDGRAAEAEPVEIELPGVANAEQVIAAGPAQFRVFVSPFPPIEDDSFVLVRQSTGTYRLARWRTLRAQAEQRRQPITGFQLARHAGSVRLTGLRIPHEAAYIVIESASPSSPAVLDARSPARLRNRAGLELGRNVVYFARTGRSEEARQTQLAGITAAGGFSPLFFTAEAAVRQAYRLPSVDLREAALVIARGETFSPEMVDYSRPAARAQALRQIAAVMKYPAFRSLYLNTRSHTQLAGDSRDGAGGIQPLPYYDPPRGGAAHLGLDLAYAPLSAGIKSIGAPAIASFHPGEWAGQCQSADCPHTWRLARNQAVAQGIHALIGGIERAFPNVPLQIVVPEAEAVSQDLAAYQRTLPAGTVSHTAGRYNYIQNIGEGMAMLELTGPRARPVLLGTGAFVSPVVLERYLDRVLANSAGRLTPPYGIMFEGQYGLKDAAGRSAREAALCAMLARRRDITEVVLYEAADWTYRLPWDGFDFLDRCPDRPVRGAERQQ